jgi:hypothetical protein
MNTTKTRRTPAQHDLPGAEDVFNLAGEAQDDPARIAREQEQREQDHKRAQEIEAQQQQKLLGIL